MTTYYKVVRADWRDWHTSTVESRVGQTVSWPQPWPALPKKRKSPDACGSVGYHVMRDLKDAFRWTGHYPAHALAVTAKGILADDGAKLRVLEYTCLEEVSLAPAFGPHGAAVIVELDAALRVPAPRTSQSPPLDIARLERAARGWRDLPVRLVGVGAARGAWAAWEAWGAWGAWEARGARGAWGAWAARGAWGLALWPCALVAQGKDASVARAIRDDILGQGCLILETPRGRAEVWVLDPSLP